MKEEVDVEFKELDKIEGTLLDSIYNNHFCR